MSVSDWLERRRVLKAFEAAKNWPPKRAPEHTPADYRIIYSDGYQQETRLLPSEINRWALACNNDSDKQRSPYPIVKIVDAGGLTVWPIDATDGHASPENLPPSKAKAIFKELFVGVVGWVWIAALLCTIYYLVRATIFDGSWSVFFGCAAAAWLLYRASLHFQLEKERTLHLIGGPGPR
jgi:hypothetical protein